jgi:NTP pyrophosphatase (non-canonical NTP hydrolase)
VAERPEKLAEVAGELADVLCYALAMANELGLDLASALAAKMAKNAEKYPAEQYRGRFGPDDPQP